MQMLLPWASTLLAWGLAGFFFWCVIQGFRTDQMGQQKYSRKADPFGFWVVMVVLSSFGLCVLGAWWFGR